MKSITQKIIVSLLLLCSVWTIKNNSGYVAPYCADIAIFVTAFFIIGNLVKTINWRNNRCICSFINFLSTPRFSIFFFALYCLLSWVIQNNIDMEFHLAVNFYKKPLLFIIISFGGILFVCFIANIFKNNFFSFLGENSLAAFAFNGKAYAISYLAVSYVPVVSTTFSAILISIFEGLILIGIAFVINKYCPFIVGKNKL